MRSLRRAARLAPMLLSSVLAGSCAVAQSAPDSSTTVRLTVDAHAAATPFPHFWEQTFGSGRAILSLRDSYRIDLDKVHGITGFDSVRFHGILNDDVGLYDPDRKTKNPGLAAQDDPSAGGTVYNFSYIDQIYDGLLAHHVRPFVELSFMPAKMASNPAAIHPFWYHPNTSPPKDYALWDGMITALAQHLIARYGIEEVSHWNFEVWNEPNLDFWSGKPAQESYFKLYDHTARDLKAVSARIRVGGPATAQAAWVGDFLKHCKDNNVPVDFASTHVYANDTAENVMKIKEDVPRDKMVCSAVKMVHDQIVGSPLPKTPLIMSEYNASYANEPAVTDSIYMGPWMATTISQCDGMTESMSYWSFSDVFEEQGVVRTPFYGGFGLMAEDNIPKPAFNVFAMLHGLGTERLKLDSDSAMLTRRADGTLVMALWNYVAPTEPTTSDVAPAGAVRRFTLTLPGGAKQATIMRVDQDHGNVIKAFDAMGKPATPSREQIKQLQQAGQASPAEHVAIRNHQLDLTIPPAGLVVLELK
ncbi:GH39 family glycosyl hydrolase [Granulicella tundricola]|uniref:Glycoside hydrolase family 39 n=1 Tax=Granulicella tundricola (strain ATCC BAA-1859 / DSM 23138 / MP5ACTX9) TaxID=1198114 RepID=E8WV76_GRATM|nr:glycosyl hydrolase family 39 [Granulicella tundricola]ADW67251.1 glycoside hydrolase family 39 [Granulicella tundricola MP5ACTX9]